jgi:hypothetical protein
VVYKCVDAVELYFTSSANVNIVKFLLGFMFVLFESIQELLRIKRKLEAWIRTWIVSE